MQWRTGKPRVVLLALVIAIALVRLGEAAAGIILPIRAASELVLAASLVCVGMSAAEILTDAARGLRIAVGVALAAWGAAVAMPLWYLGHPPAKLHEGELGGGIRSAQTPPAPRNGVYRVEARAQPSPATSQGSSLLHVGAGSTEQLLVGNAGQVATTEMRLERGQALRLFLERSEGKLVVTVQPLPLPWSWVRWLALAVAALTAAIDAIGFCARAPWRGALAAAVGASAAYVALLEPATSPGGLAALGLVAVFAGAVSAFAVPDAVRIRHHRKRRPA